MEAAFVDFGASKNGVVYADDISHTTARSTAGKHPHRGGAARGDEVLVQVVRDAMGAKGARLTNQPSIPDGLVLVPDSDAQGISRRPTRSEPGCARWWTRRGPTAWASSSALRPRSHTQRHRRGRLRLVGTWAQIREAAAAGGAPDSSTKSRSCSFG